jgi:WXXGXW repeat (2 copies)
MAVHQSLALILLGPNLLGLKIEEPMSMRAILPILFLFGAALILAPVSSIAKVGIVVGIAPPAPVVETVPPPPPPPGNVWQPGYWAWDGTKYAGYPGYTRWPLIRAPCGWRVIGSDAAAAGFGMTATGGDRLPFAENVSPEELKPLGRRVVRKLH